MIFCPRLLLLVKQFECQLNVDILNTSHLNARLIAAFLQNDLRRGLKFGIFIDWIDAMRAPLYLVLPVTMGEITETDSILVLLLSASSNGWRWVSFE